MRFWSEGKVCWNVSHRTDNLTQNLNKCKKWNPNQTDCQHSKIKKVKFTKCLTADKTKHLNHQPDKMHKSRQTYNNDRWSLVFGCCFFADGRKQILIFSTYVSKDRGYSRPWTALRLTINHPEHIKEHKKRWLKCVPWCPSWDPWKDHKCLTDMSTSYIVLKQKQVIP